MSGFPQPPSALTVAVKLVDDATAVTVGEGKFKMTVTSDLNGRRMLAPVATVSVAPTGTGLSFGVRKNAATEMLSTNLTVDTTKVSSSSSATPPVVNAANATVATDDVISIDVDTADSNAADRGAIVRLSFA